MIKFLLLLPIVCLLAGCTPTSKAIVIKIGGCALQCITKCTAEELGASILQEARATSQPAKRTP